MVPAIFESHPTRQRGHRAQSLLRAKVAPRCPQVSLGCPQVSPVPSWPALLKSTSFETFPGLERHKKGFEAKTSLFSQSQLQFVVVFFHCLQLSPAFGADSDFQIGRKKNKIWEWAGAGFSGAQDEWKVLRQESGFEILCPIGSEGGKWTNPEFRVWNSRFSMDNPADMLVRSLQIHF